MTLTPGTIETNPVPEIATDPTTVAVTVPVTTAIKPVAVAVKPDEAVVNAAFTNETVPET